jgi:hypothetical protein
MMLVKFELLSANSMPPPPCLSPFAMSLDQGRTQWGHTEAITHGGCISLNVPTKIPPPPPKILASGGGVDFKTM